ncbi:hypothetical protein K1X12_05310 [Hyphomonas sp. WL0036]|uniref:hypothetical protein n=1 Tax=Hyphomonas sediminis TaxID=2866160 RepID=UPI001C81BC93|nr:hypothetical protein [Hyphomonas sediminis]MBY9066306.1 hypothetical protein [Hyphomonas sediminis]
MSAAFYIFLGGFIVWLALRSSARRAEREARYNPRDDEFERLSRRVRTLEQIITDRDWRLRRDIDGLG